MKTIKKYSMDVCSVCNGQNLHKFIDLPKFPQIGIYLDLADSDDNSPCVDNALVHCADCGHVQMQYAVDPAFLYDTGFQHKTSQSASAMQANNFLYEFVKKRFGDLEQKTVAEVGCNDSFFLRKFAEDHKCSVVGVDPTLSGNEATFLQGLEPQLADKFTLVGDFIENVDFVSVIGSKPDILISNFVFEHLKEPRTVVESMLSAVADEGMCFIGVPTIEFMCFNARFDQLSHQHYQQFSVRSLHQLVEEVGGKVLGFEKNFTNWGQTVVVFGRGQGTEEYKKHYKFEMVDLTNAYEIFCRDIETMKVKVDHLARGREVVGFGAAQNFPVLHYFAGKEVPFDVIYDDHPLRQNKKFPFVENITTRKPDDEFEGKVGVLTGPDYGRVLFKRMGDLSFDHIVSPFSSY